MTFDLTRREDLEEREASWLAPYAMQARHSAGRVYADPEHARHTAYQRDRQRIVHSRAFRRLQYKTQVFVNHEGDYYRTRLTHTVEAAQIARAAARALRLNEDLAEAIALAHDIGHPPFGHAGERALAALMANYDGFEHNAQALRLVDLLERRYTAHRGLNLSYEVREGLWKQRDSDTCRAFGYDEEVFRRDQGALLEAQVSDAADGIAYDHHDLDDALKSGLIRLDDLRALSFVGAAEALVEERMRAAGARADRAERVRRQELVRQLMNEQVRDLIETTHARLRAERIAGLPQVRAYTRKPPLVTLSPAMLARKQELQRFLQERVYRHYRVKRQVEKGERFIADLFHELVAKPHLLPDEYQEWVERAGVQRGVCDYVAGMTDRYAQREHQKLFAVFEPM